MIKGHEPRIIFNNHIYTHFILHIHLAISLFISCFHFHAIASMATHAIHSIPIVPNPIFIFLNTLFNLSSSYIYIMHLKALVSLIFIFTALFHGLFVFLFTFQRKFCHCNLHWGWSRVLLRTLCKNMYYHKVKLLVLIFVIKCCVQSGLFG